MSGKNADVVAGFEEAPPEGRNALDWFASNGLEALMVYSSYRINLDLVLTDIDMPQMNGIELAVRIRDLDPAKKILMMSGRVQSDAERKIDCPFLPKPFRPDQLVEAVNTALGQ